jgi:hypothetical protein
MEESKGFFKEAGFLRWFGLAYLLVILVLLSVISYGSFSLRADRSQSYGILLGIVFIAIPVVKLIAVGKKGKFRTYLLPFVLLAVSPIIFVISSGISFFVAMESRSDIIFNAVFSGLVIVYSAIIFTIMQYKQRQPLSIK